MFKKILWCTNFTEPALRAGQQAFQCAQCSEGMVYVLTVIHPEDLPLVLQELPDPSLDENHLRVEYE